MTIYGSGFAGVRDVDFGQALAKITSESSTQITVTSPRGSGVVDVSVVTAGGKSAITTKDQFTYQTVGGSTSAPPPGTGG